MHTLMHMLRVTALRPAAACCLAGVSDSESGTCCATFVAAFRGLNAARRASMRLAARHAACYRVASSVYLDIAEVHCDTGGYAGGATVQLRAAAYERNCPLHLLYAASDPWQPALYVCSLRQVRCVAGLRLVCVGLESVMLAPRYAMANAAR